MSVPQSLKAITNIPSPIPFEDFMAWNNNTYYARNTALISPEGDFITAPEISSLFGEMIALWIILQWKTLGSPARIQLVEMGPGNGTLMHDVLKTLQHFQKRGQAEFSIASVFLVEKSPSLKDKQKRTLSAFQPLHHAEDILGLQKKLPSLPTFFIANEFFDALPISQYQLTPEKTWNKLYIQMKDEAPTPLFCPANAVPNHILQYASTPGLYEYCPEIDHILPPLFEILKKNPGAFLFIDYGNRTSKKDTLQALKHHQFVDLYATPGEVDITAHVDFYHIETLIPPSMQTHFQDQGAFLKEMGILLRLKSQLSKLPLPAQKKLLHATERLIGADPQGKNMGILFKVLGGITIA